MSIDVDRQICAIMFFFAIGRGLRRARQRAPAHRRKFFR